MRSKQFSKLFKDLLTADHLARMFRVRSMTIHNWVKTRHLPVVVIPGLRRDSIRFIREEVEEWARKNNQQIHSLPRVRIDHAA